VKGVVSTPSAAPPLLAALRLPPAPPVDESLTIMSASSKLGLAAV
jgi:hypothetical protein